MNESQRGTQVQRAARGNADALQKLLVHYHRPLHGIIERRMPAGLRRHVDPDDILQTVYTTAFQRVSDCTFDGPAGFYKWIERIALDRLRDTERDLRRKKRDIGRNLSGAQGITTSYPRLIERLSAGGSTPSKHLAQRETSAAIISSLARLTEDQRSVVPLLIRESQAVFCLARQVVAQTAVVVLAYVANRPCAAVCGPGYGGRRSWSRIGVGRAGVGSSLPTFLDGICSFEHCLQYRPAAPED